MSLLKGKQAIVVGASSGVGRATLLALAAAGARVCGVARGRERLERIAREAPGDVTPCAGDATLPEVATTLLREKNPDIVVLAAGVKPPLAAVDEHTWESFSAAWNGDMKIAFHFCQEALRLPLKPGSVVVTLSSGAALGGSPLSGGYAGAKRMQWLLSAYAQKVSAAKNLGIRFVTVVPKQLIVGTAIGEDSSAAYAALAGISQEKFMERFAVPLFPDGVAAAIVRIAEGAEGAEAEAIAVTGGGIEAL